jgi:ADP-heptose:LPS heptosyltransferase
MMLRGSIPPSAPSRILLVQLRRIGDVLLCTPAIRTLAERFPQSKIDFAVEAPCDEAVWGHPCLDRLLVAPRGSTAREILAFVRTVRSEKYDWTIDFFSNPRSAQLTFVSGAPVRVGLNRRGRKWAYTHRIVEDESDRDVYAVDWRLRILQQLGIEPSSRALEVFADRVDEVEAARAAKALCQLNGRTPVAAVATGNPNAEKNYPPAKFAEVIRGLRRAGIEVVVTSGPGETPAAEEAIALSGECVPHLRGARVPALAALYRKVQVFVGVDSSPKHVAAACGVPTVTLFGMGNAANWNDPLCATNILLKAPDSPPHFTSEEYLRGKFMERIDPALVVDAARKLIAMPGN